MIAASVSGAYAQDSAPLAPGKPAGVQKAQFWEGQNGIFLVAGAALIGITAGLASASGGVSGNTGGGSGTGTGTSTSTGTTTP